jgi:hypothetical protein
MQYHLEMCEMHHSGIFSPLVLRKITTTLALSREEGPTVFSLLLVGLGVTTGTSHLQVTRHVSYN